jgi:hypothetical protein
MARQAVRSLHSTAAAAVHHEQQCLPAGKEGGSGHLLPLAFKCALQALATEIRIYAQVDPAQAAADVTSIAGLPASLAPALQAASSLFSKAPAVSLHCCPSPYSLAH